MILAASPALAQDEGQRVYRQTLKSTVLVLVPQPDRAGQDGRIPISQGSGSLIDATRRIILTNYHVVGSADTCTIMFPMFEGTATSPIAERDRYIKVLDRRGIRGKVLVREPKVDLALVQLDSIPTGTPILKLAKESVTPGQRVHSVGNPGSSDGLWLYTFGTVRQVYRKQWLAGKGNEVSEHDAHIIETQSPTNPGDSGGPLVNDAGELVGVTQGGSSRAQLLSIFIDVREVKTLLAKARIPIQIAKAKEEKPKENTTADEKTPPKETTPPATGGDADEKAAAKILTRAKNYIEDGLFIDARDECKKIIDKYPNTKAATEAKDLMDKKLRKK